MAGRPTAEHPVVIELEVAMLRTTHLLDGEGTPRRLVGGKSDVSLGQASGEITDAFIAEYGGLDEHESLHTSGHRGRSDRRSEEHTSELQSLMRNSYAVFCLKKKNKTYNIYVNVEIKVYQNQSTFTHH